MPSSMPSWKLRFFWKRENNLGLTVTVESAPGTLRPIILLPSRIFDRWEPGTTEGWALLQQVVLECESQYPLGAGFGNCLFVKGGDPTEVYEDLHPNLLSHLPRVTEFLGTGRTWNATATISLADLRKPSFTPYSLSYQTSLVVFKDQLYLAKGPTNKESIDYVLPEIGILKSLPKHHSIISPPIALITISPDDDGLIGFLLKYYPNGNVGDYVIKHRSRLGVEILSKRAAQIAGVLGYLLHECKFTYIDIKPDNVLVDEHENLVLADFSLDGCTSWIAAPEMFHGYPINVSADGEEFSYTKTQSANTTMRPRLDTMPDSWPANARDKAMVYSVGRSLWIIWEAIPAEKFIMSAFRPSPGFDPMQTVFGQSDTPVPQAIKDMILRCVQEDPCGRPSLAEVQTFFEKQSMVTQCVRVRTNGSH